MESKEENFKATGKEIDTAQDEDGYLCLKAYN